MGPADMRTALIPPLGLEAVRFCAQLAPGLPSPPLSRSDTIVFRAYGLWNVAGAW